MRLSTPCFAAVAVLFYLLASETASAQTGCRLLYPAKGGWAIDLCEQDPSFGERTAVEIDGVPQGLAAMVRVYHTTDDGTGLPQVVVVNASGFLRLKPNADPPGNPIPYGSSFVLGPGYWPSGTTYHHSPAIAGLEIDTPSLPRGPLRMSAEGTNHDFDVTWEMTLPAPRDHQTRLHVDQTWTARAPVTIDPVRRTEAQGLKLVQVSSMFIGSGCDGGLTDCHDSDALRLIDSTLERRQLAFGSVPPGTLLFNPGALLGSTWLDVLHTDDASWQGNTPNVRIALDALDPARLVAAQAFITPTMNPNDDNVNAWLADGSTEAASWTVGESGSASYWLIAQDDPPEPWGDLSLRTGLTFLDFEGASNCQVVQHPSASGSTQTIAGYTGQAKELDYDLGTGNGNWIQIRCDFSPAVDLSAFDHFRLDWRGSAAGNSLEVGLINPGGDVFARGYHHPAQRSWWGQLVIPFRHLKPWTVGTTFDPSQVAAVFVSVVKDPVDDVGGTGSVAIDNLGAFNVDARTLPAGFERVPAHPVAAEQAAEWIASRQRPTGLVDSWEEEAACISHLYDQALALIVFVRERLWDEADALVAFLAAQQNSDGSWFRTRDCDSGAVLSAQIWEGDIAWTVFALDRYIRFGGTHAQAEDTRNDGADWLVTRIGGDGCLVIDHTEGTLDTWWALYMSGYTAQADGLRNCLLTRYWDDTAGRFKAGRGTDPADLQRDWVPYLDNQTWGAPFLREIGERTDALRALTYARETLLLPAQGGQVHGFDGQGGPWSLWNEGTGQYAAAGGPGAGDLVLELLAQQREDGAMPSSTDDFTGAGVWTSRWHGLAPTAWLYFALTGEPFPRGADFHTVAPCRVYDSRTVSPLLSGAGRLVAGAGSCGIPVTAQALSLNVTAIDPTGGGHIILYPADLPLPPLTSTLNFPAGRSRANNAIIPLSPDGVILARPVLGSGQVHIAVDVNGYFE
ncbi:MAG TPA: carbohydrate binding domain-containing protein [Thermoanaerobaculia bacterium]|nr:carbohydrate binding domain-containing protein [Thermoanaerobaculia bacterium]